MKIQPQVKGYICAFGAAISLASSFVFSKNSLIELDGNILLFGIYWFGLGIIWNILYVLIFRKLQALKDLKGRTAAVTFSVALLEAIATGLFYIAINKVANPAIVAFLGSIGPVFVTIMGITFLKERFSPLVTLGILITIFGVITIAYSGVAKLSAIFIAGSGYVVAASFIFSIAAIIARKYNHNFNSGILSLIRVIILAVVFSVLVLGFNQSLEISPKAFLSISIGSILETLITIVLAYEAYIYIEATKTSVIISSKSIFTLLIVFIFWGILPESYKIFGGILTIIGVSIVTLGKRKV